MSDSPAHADDRFWHLSPDQLCNRLGCGLTGLTAADASERLDRFGPNSDARPRVEGAARAIMRRLLEPLSLILLVAGIVSMLTGDDIGGLIIVLILALSIELDTVQEGHALQAAEVLRRSVALKAEVRRDNDFREIDVDRLVPGDILRVRSGDIIPADALILECTAFTAGEAALTGEPYPVQKRAGATTDPDDTSNALFRGAVAQTGEAIALVVRTGRDTVFGAAASALAEAQTPSPFERDLREFGLVIARATLALVLVVLSVRVVFGRPVMDSLLFAVALAVGLTPELLPMITTVTLSRGALRMAGRKVIVKRLAAIHDLGAMTVLCTDKTGTLTSAEITLAKSLDAAGKDDARAARLGAIAAKLGGDRGSLDAALVAGQSNAAQGWTLAGRQAFDFSRRLGSVLATGPEGALLIVKGAPEAVLELCVMDDGARTRAIARVHELASEGLRSIAIASRPWTGATREVETADETDLVFEGFCAFADPPKPTAAAAIARLAATGITLKILSGDDPVVVKRLAGLVGLNADRVLSGADIAELSDEALAVQVQSTDAYGRLAPDQKSRVVKALQAGGAVVGFLGDGINDAPALKAADIGLSVEGATGVAQAAADIILLASDLEVVADGVEEGRRTFANIMKYVRMGASSNFGNMLSMAIASMALPFLADAADADSAQQPALRSLRARHSLRPGLARGHRAAAGLEHDSAGAFRRDHGAAVLGLRLPDLRRSHPAVSSVAGRIPHRLVHRIHGDADPRDLHHSHQRPTVAQLARSGAVRLIAGRLAGRNGGAFHAGRRLVRLCCAATAHDGRHRASGCRLSRLRRTVEAVCDPCRTEGLSGFRPPPCMDAMRLAPLISAGFPCL